MVDVEILEFNVPSGKSTLLLLQDINTDVDQDSLYTQLYDTFSKFGLLYKVSIISRSDNSAKCAAYIRFYSGWCCSRARSAVQRRRLHLTDICGKQVRLGKALERTGTVPLLKAKCEELANYYLGFNGWRSSVLYHQQEHSDPLTIKIVTVVKLDFVADDLSCEGAGMIQESLLPDDLSGQRINVAKRSISEAFLAAWAKVLLIIVNGSKVSVEINTTKRDSFIYNPLWGEPEVEVNEVDDGYVDDEPDVTEQQ